MGTSSVGSVGDVVLVVFPVAGFTGFKKRPALVVGRTEDGELILCQITADAAESQTAVIISDRDFRAGGLGRRRSYVRPDKVFTASPSIVDRKAGTLLASSLAVVKRQVRQLFV